MTSLYPGSLQRLLQPAQGGSMHASCARKIEPEKRKTKSFTPHFNRSEKIHFVIGQNSKTEILSSSRFISFRIDHGRAQPVLLRCSESPRRGHRDCPALQRLQCRAERGHASDRAANDEHATRKTLQLQRWRESGVASYLRYVFC